MGPLSLVPLPVVLAALPRWVTGQALGQPNLGVTLFGGVVAGPSLWSTGQQPLCVLAGSAPTFTCTAQYDTLRVARDIAASLTLGASGTYFKNPHLGFQGEIFFLGMPFEDGCNNIAPYNADADRKNEQLCNDIRATSLSTSAIAFFVGVIVRASPAHWFSPYLRVGGGLAVYSGGTVSLSGRFAQGGTVDSRAVILDTTPKSSSLSAQIGVGATAAISPGYQLRIDLRDAVIPLARVGGRANPPTPSLTTLKLYHHFSQPL